MSVHQISEFYIHIEVEKSKHQTVSNFLLEECVDFNFDGTELTVDGFDSEFEAKRFEGEIKALL